MGALCFRHGRSGPVAGEFTQLGNRVGKFVGHRSEAKAEMRGCIPTIPGREQDALFCSGLTKSAAVLSTEKPWKCGRPATRGNPAERLAMFPHESIKLAKISRCCFLRFAKYRVPVAHRDLRQHFSSSIVGDGDRKSTR